MLARVADLVTAWSSATTAPIYVVQCRGRRASDLPFVHLRQ